MNDLDTTERIRTDAYRPPPWWSGSVFGIVALSITVLIIGWYGWYRVHEPERQEPSPPIRVNDEPETIRANADVLIAESMSPSDELPMIQSDLEATHFDTIDADLQAIEAELAEFESKINAP